LSIAGSYLSSNRSRLRAPKSLHVMTSHKTILSLTSTLGLAALTGLPFSVFAEPAESDFYKITSFATPEGAQVETTGIAIMPDGKNVAVSTRRGQIWLVDGVLDAANDTATWSTYAEYLHEPIGLSVRDGWLYAVQRPEVTRMKDEDGDGRADVFETFADGWGITGDYHEYAFGSTHDPDGNLYVALCLTGSFTAQTKFRGWTLKITPDGRTVPFASGLRSPGGIGYNFEGDLFYTDNQGAWNGTSSLKHVAPGSFQGNPNGNVYYDVVKDRSIVGEKPPYPSTIGAEMRTDTERQTIPNYRPPALYFPHKKLGQSPTGIVPDCSAGKFGPFAGQTFVAEQTHSAVQRCFLEKVNGVYQGAAFPFLKGFKSGNIGLLMTDDGMMLTGGSNRGWGASGGKPQSLERVTWTGEVPFEVLTMSARKDGFELTFTQPVDIESMVAESLTMTAYTYKYHKEYGSDEVDQVDPTLEVVSVAADGKSARIKVTPMTKGHVHELHLKGVKNSAGESLLHPVGYYTLNEIPSE